MSQILDYTIVEPYLLECFSHMLQLNKLAESRPDVSYLNLNQIKFCKSFAYVFILYW